MFLWLMLLEVFFRKEKQRLYWALFLCKCSLNRCCHGLLCFVSFCSLIIQMLPQVQWSMAWVHHVLIWGAGLARVSCLHQGNFAGNQLHTHLTPCREIHWPMHPGELIKGDERIGRLRYPPNQQSFNVAVHHRRNPVTVIIDTVYYFILSIKCCVWWLRSSILVKNVKINRSAIIKKKVSFYTYVSQQPTPTGCRQVHCIHALSIQVSPIE